MRLKSIFEISQMVNNVINLEIFEIDQNTHNYTLLQVF